MFFKPKTIKKIMVELVDADSHGDVTQLLDTPVDVIPEALQAGSTVTFGTHSYTLQKADPQTRDEASEAGHLRLVVRRITSSEDGVAEETEQSPRLSTYPSVCAELPPLSGESKIGKRAYVINTSDWRQIEFASRALQPQIDACIAAVNAVITNNEVDGGYPDHNMREFAPPLAALNIPFSAITDLFAESRLDLDGVAVFGHRNMIAGGFAFQTASVTELYGYCENGLVQALCIGGIGTYEYDSPEVQAIADFCAEYDLCLIDWPSAAVFYPENEDFFAFFDPPGDFDEVFEQAPL